MKITGKDFKIPLLMDFYGSFLSKTQHDNLDYYYNQDLSLSEISDHTGKSRQGVRDSIKKAENILCDIEKKLGLSAKTADIKKNINKIVDLSQKIKSNSENQEYSQKIDKYIRKILEISDKF